MATKRQSSASMTSGEQFAGTVFFVIYLLVLPLAAEPLFRTVNHLLDISPSQATQDAIYHYILFAVTIVIFHGFLVRTSQKLADDLSEAVKTVAVGLVALYGLNELLYRLLRTFTADRVNLNDFAISARVGGAPRMTALIVILLAPFVEEVLFRGLVFGCLKSRSRLGAYVLSCALFAAMHVWRYSLAGRDITYFLVGLQYLVPGVVLCWAYEHSGTLWTSIALHAAANALAILTM